MELTHMRYFAAVAETESVTKAAQQLGISPPSLSNAINKLESELGVDLLEPAGRGIRLNETGRTLYARIKPLIDEFDLVIKETTQRDDVGVIISIATAWGDMLVDFTAKRPDILLRTEVGSAGQAKALFTTNKYDFWITATDASEYADVFDMRELCAHTIMLAVHESHPLAQRESVALHELKDEKFLFPLDQYKSSRYHMSICRGAGFEPNVVAIGNPQKRIGMVSRNEGISFLECIENKGDFFHGVTLVKISDLPHRQPCYICSRKGRNLSPNAKIFLDFALRYYGTAE